MKFLTELWVSLQDKLTAEYIDQIWEMYANEEGDLTPEGTQEMMSDLTPSYSDLSNREKQQVFQRLDLN